jgi:hypothetical protein
MNYDNQMSVYRQLHRKRLDNLFKYCDDYANNVEALTKLDPYVREIGITDELLEKSMGVSFKNITSLTLTMVRYLKDDEHVQAFRARDGLLNLIHMM